MKALLLLALLAGIIAGGCENVKVITPEITYQEFIVVRAELKAYNVFEGVSFTKTLPLNETYDIKKAELKNVMAYLKINGIVIIPLHYSHDGVYMPGDNISIRPGYTYELFAEVNNTTIYSVTKVPQTPVVLSAVYKDNRFFEISLTPNAGEVYGAAWQIYNPASGNLLAEASDFRTITEAKPNEINNSLTVNTKDLPPEYSTGSYGSFMYAEVYAFDSQYLKYFKSKNNNQPTGNALAQGGDLIAWNVQGDHVIGLFIGLAVKNYVKVKF